MKTPAIAKGTRTRVEGSMFRSEEQGPVHFQSMRYPRTTFIMDTDPGIAFGVEVERVVAEVDLSENTARFLYEVNES